MESHLKGRSFEIFSNGFLHKNYISDRNFKYKIKIFDLLFSQLFFELSARLPKFSKILTKISQIYKIAPKIKIVFEDHL